jgi:pyruvate-ferredoxin/flavodoxin oxidoreductase
VLVVQTASAFQGHFMKNVMEFLNYNASPALLDTYTSCMSEHGIADDAGNRQARLAVESRMYPIFVHDPRKGDTLAERFSLDGNPDIGKNSTMTSIQYIDDDGNTQLKEIPFTPADFGLHEGRFKKHYRPANGEAETVPIDEFIKLSEEERYGKAPFIWSTDDDRKLIKLIVSPAIVDLTEERLRNWRMLEYLSGLHIDRMNEEHIRALEEWREKYQRANQDRERSIDDIARGMSQLATASNAPAGSASGATQVSLPSRSAPETTKPGATPDSGLPLVAIADDDLAKCTNCKTCYQDLSELFEKTTIVVDGEAKEVSRVIPGALDKVQLTPEIIARASRVADDCDAEIIQFNQPG